MAVVVKHALVALAFSYSLGLTWAFTCFLLSWTLIVFGLALFGSVYTHLITLPGKDTLTGKIPLYRVLLFLPYYTAVGILMVISIVWSYFNKYQHCTEIAPGIFVGDYFSSFSREWAAVIDITNEFPRLNRSGEYLNIQSWDGCPPTIESLQRAVTFSITSDRPLLIHCAHGKGRSVTVACAVLVALKVCGSVEEAMMRCKSLRPQSRVNPRMRTRLIEWFSKSQ
jgi:hypothetical protein